MGCQLCKPNRDDVRVYHMPDPGGKRKRLGRLKRWMIKKVNNLLQVEKYRPDQGLLHSRFDDVHTRRMNEILATDRLCLALPRVQAYEKQREYLDLSESLDQAVRGSDRCSMCSLDTLYGVLDIPYDYEDTNSQDVRQISSSSLTIVTPASFTTKDEVNVLDMMTFNPISRHYRLSSMSSITSLPLITPVSLSSGDQSDAFTTVISHLPVTADEKDLDEVNGQLIIHTEPFDEGRELFDERVIKEDCRVREDRKRRQGEDRRRCDEEKIMAEKDEKELLELIEQFEAMV